MSVKPGERSGRHRADEAQAAAGAAGLFTKPIDFPQLRGEIGRVLSSGAASEP
jgi:hypothetical protein